MRGPFPTARAALLAAALGAGFLLEPLGAPFLLATLAADLCLLVLFGIDVRLARRQRLEVRRRIPSRLFLDRPCEVSLEVRNDGPWTARLRLSDDLSPALEGGVGPGPRCVLPGETLAVSATVKPAARGEHALGPVRMRVEGPLRLSWRERRFDTREVVKVYPDWGILSTWERLLVRGRSRAVGLRPSREIGQGSEFESLRDFQPGDDPRHLDWKVSVRRGRLSFRSREFERQQNVLLLLDTGRTTTARWKERERLEVSLEAAGLLAWVAVRHHDRVGVVWFSGRVHGVLPPCTGPAAVGRVREILLRARADLEEPDYREAFAVARSLLPKRSLLLVFTDPVGTAMSEEIGRQFGEGARRHLNGLVTLRDPEIWRIAGSPAATPRDLARKASAEAIVEERARALRALEARGVSVVDAFPWEVAAGVVGRYLDLKSRALL